jgi:hypothetical protein
MVLTRQQYPDCEDIDQISSKPSKIWPSRGPTVRTRRSWADLHPFFVLVDHLALVWGQLTKCGDDSNFLCLDFIRYRKEFHGYPPTIKDKNIVWCKYRII